MIQVVTHIKPDKITKLNIKQVGIAEILYALIYIER